MKCPVDKRVGVKHEEAFFLFWHRCIVSHLSSFQEALFPFITAPNSPLYEVVRSPSSHTLALEGEVSDVLVLFVVEHHPHKITVCFRGGEQLL